MDVVDRLLGDAPTAAGVLAATVGVIALASLSTFATLSEQQNVIIATARHREEDEGGDTAKEADSETSSNSSTASASVPMVWRENQGQEVLVPLFYPSRAEKPHHHHNTSKSTKKKVFRAGITVEEVAKHDTREDAWIVVHERVYDVTKFVDLHPGGWLAMAQHVGKPDVTDAFEAFHPAQVHKTLASMAVGQMAPGELNRYRLEISGGRDTKEDPLEQIARDMREELLRAGMFRTSSWYYVALITWLASLFVLSIVLTLFTSHYWMGAVVMGLFWQQFAFVGHDIGHNALTHERSLDYFWGALIGNTLLGVSLGWWKQNHNVHHVNCNSVENDPDIQHMPVFAVTEKVFEGRFWSTYHLKYVFTDVFARTLVSMQHILFYPVMAVARVNLYVQSWVLILLQRQGPMQYRFMEAATLLVFITWLTALVSQLPNQPRDGILWTLLAHAVSGLLHVQICISHFSMDAHSNGDVARKTGFYGIQLQTTMDVDNVPALDWLHGGLQFQVEHHLFPRLPRHNLRAARALLKKHLRQHNLEHEYREETFLRANMSLLASMRRVALNARKLQRGDGGFYSSMLYDGLHAIG